jgi:DnaJ-class molecular chaperone
VVVRVVLILVVLNLAHFLTSLMIFLAILWALVEVAGVLKKSRSNRGSDLKINLEITSEEVILETNNLIYLQMKNVKIVLEAVQNLVSKPKKCSTCNGHGRRTQQGFFTYNKHVLIAEVKVNASKSL